MPWWELLSLFSTVFVAPVIATEPLALPLPQTTDYATYMKGQLLAADFSTDPHTTRPHVAAANSGLEAFIINYEPCAVVNDAIAYRLVVRNLGSTPLNGVVAQFTYPGTFDFKEANPIPAAGVAANAGSITWTIDTLLPGPENFQELNVTFVLTALGDTTTQLLVSGGGGVAGTSHSIPGNCPASAGSRVTPLPNKEPVILCDPGERNCENSAPILGRMFGQVANDPGRQPTVCAPNNDPDSCLPNEPRLGARFAEATASLQPGECSVLDDAVFSDPAFQDGLLRGKNVAAFFMQPLYNSGQDFSRVVLENELLGIANKLYAKNILRAIHTKHWQARVQPLQDVLRGGLSTNDIRGRIDQWNAAWIAETRSAQQDLAQRYQALQQTREKKFDPVGNQAVANAKDSIERACHAPLFPPREPDAGLHRILFDPPSVKQEYVKNLNDRGRAYTATQQIFVSQPTTWQQELRAALDAFDAGDRRPLEQFAAQIPNKDSALFEDAWGASYEKHAQEDVKADNAIRLNEWEPALDVPKAVAAACARDITLAARVEFSWCESGTYPENYISPEALQLPHARDVAEPEPIGGGENANIDTQRVGGVSCRGLSGDPFWAADCSCNCNELVPKSDGNILFCQVSKKLKGVPSNPGDIKPIIRDDIYAIARTGRDYEECLNEYPFDDHFLVNY